MSIERCILDGNTLHQETGRFEDEWPQVYDEEADEMVPYEPVADFDTENIALDNVTAHQIMDELSEKDIEILTAEHGDGPALAEKYRMSVEAVWVKKHRLIKKMQEKFM